MISMRRNASGVGSATSSLVSDSTNASIMETAQQVQDTYNPRDIFAQLEKELTEKSANFKLGDTYAQYDHNDGIFTR